mgnify:FL=1
MAITRAFNKHSGVYYAYDVQYVWSEEAQKKVQVRKCIGKFDPETNQVVPNGKRGPKPVKEFPNVSAKTASDDKSESSFEGGKTDTAQIPQQELVNAVSDGFRQINDTLQQIVEYIKTVSPVSED